MLILQTYNLHFENQYIIKGKSLLSGYENALFPSCSLPNHRLEFVFPTQVKPVTGVHRAF
jgi:hypothetical protein